jgi:hypothetical protein
MRRRPGRRVTTINQQLQQYDGDLVIGSPKRTRSCRTVALDRTTLTALRRHRLLAERDAAGEDYRDSGYVFTTLRDDPDRAGSNQPPVPRPDRRRGAASDPPARPAPRRCHPRPGHRGRPAGRAGHARALQHRADRRHLRPRPADLRPQGRGTGHQASLAGQPARARHRPAAPSRSTAPTPRDGGAIGAPGPAPTPADADRDRRLTTRRSPNPKSPTEEANRTRRQQR